MPLANSHLDVSSFQPALAATNPIPLGFRLHAVRSDSNGTTTSGLDATLSGLQPDQTAALSSEQNNALSDQSTYAGGSAAGFSMLSIGDAAHSMDGGNSDVASLQRAWPQGERVCSGADASARGARSPDSEDEDQPDLHHAHAARALCRNPFESDGDESPMPQSMMTHSGHRVAHSGAAAGAHARVSLQGLPSAGTVAARELAATLDNRFEALMLSPDHQVPLLYNSLGRHVCIHGTTEGPEDTGKWGRKAVFGSTISAAQGTKSSSAAGMQLLSHFGC